MASSSAGPLAPGDGEEMLASLAPPPPPAPVGEPPEKGQRKRGGNAAAAEGDLDVPLASLAVPSPLRREGRRNRCDETKRLLHECILGYQEGEDPEQSGTTRPRQSDEITELAAECKKANLEPPPVAKSQRGLYVWVAKADTVHGQDVFTMDPEQMTSVVNFEIKEQNRCDICGQAATETLFEFRCYRRRPQDQPSLGEARALEPFISYISKACGAGLLGVRSEASKFREMVFRFVHGACTPEALQAFWQSANATIRGMLLSELGIMAGIEAGDRRATVQQELRHLEAMAEWGPLHKVAEDPFRALSRALFPAFSARDLAAVTVLVAGDKQVELQESSYLFRVRQSLTDGRPVPAPPAPWSASDVMDTLKALVEALPMRVTLFSVLQGTQEFVSEATSKAEATAAEQHKAKLAKAAAKATGRGRPRKSPAQAETEQPPPSTPSMKLAYASGCSSLHGPQVQRLESAQQSRLKEACAELVQRARALFGTSPGVSGVSSRGPTSIEDRGIEVPEQVTLQDVRRALESVITWPQCTSRANVRPAGQASIDAFMLGLIKPYFQGLMCSRRTRMLPNLTRLCAKMANAVENIAFTSIQLNKDYNARLHVDKNNHGPSWIIGLGDYEGGELWVMDEQNGNHDLEIDERMPGYGHLFGQKVRGRLLNIKDQWVKFDGNLPHKAMAFKGTRISIVYFTRKGWLEMEMGPRRMLEDMGFPIPSRDFSFEATGTGQRDGDGNLVMQPRFADGVAEQGRGDAGDEVDENEEMHFEGSAEPRLFGWAECIRDTLRAEWWAEEAKPHLGLVACRAGLGPGSALALQELLPIDKSRVLCVAEDKTESGDREGRLAGSKIKVARHSVKAECGYSTLDEFASGTGFCEIQHQGGIGMPAKEAEHVFVASIQVAPISAHYQLTQNSANDRWAKQLRTLRKHLEDRRPPLVLIDVEDWREVHGKHQQRVLEIALHDREAPGGPLGLCTVGGYNAELLEVRLQDCGLPVAGARAMLMMMREDCGAAEDLKAAVHLARLLLSRLPRCTVQDLLAGEEDATLAEARAEWAKGGRPQAAIGRQRAYIDHLRKEYGNDFVDKAWYPVDSKQRSALNQAYDEAQKSGLDVGSLVVNLGQAVKQKPWRDDGLLPAAVGSRAYGPHYSFLRHRPLTGREELLCRGLPVSRLQLKGFSDGDLRRMAPMATPPPVAGAALAALLAIADLRLPQGRSLQLPQAQLKELIAQAPPAPPGSLTAEKDKEKLAAGIGEAGEGNPADGGQISSRAVAYLNLLNGLNNEAGQDTLTDEDRRAAEELGKVAMAAADGMAMDDITPVEAPIDASAVAAMASKPDEPRDWSKRRKNLVFWADVQGVTTADTAMRWVLEAAEHETHAQAPEIIQFGCEYIKNVFKPKGEQFLAKRNLPRLENARSGTDFGAVDRLLGPLLQELIAIGLKPVAGDVEDIVREALFLRRLIEKDQSVILLDGAGAEWADSYVQKVLLPLRGDEGRRAWLLHMAARLRDGWDPKDFLASRGFEAISEFLGDYKSLLEGWGKQAAVPLKVLAEKVPGSHYKLYRRVLAAAGHLVAAGQPEREQLVRREVEQAMVRVVRELLEASSTQTEEVLGEFCLAGNHLGSRFEATKRLATIAERIQKSTSAASAEMKVSSYWRGLMQELDLALQERDKTDGRLAASAATFAGLKVAEDSFTEEARAQLMRLDQVASRREAGEEQERKEAEAKAKRQLEEENRETLGRVLQDWAQKVRRAVDSYSPSADGLTDGNFKKVKDLMEALVSARAEFMKANGKPEQAVAEEIDKAEGKARALALAWCQRPLRLQMAKKRLEEAGLARCLDILERSQMLGRLDDLQASSGATALLDGLGLPPSARQKVVRMAMAGEFAEEKLRPLVPRGFKKEIYEPHGLWVLVDEQTGDKAYPWPAQKVIITNKPREPQDPPLPQNFRMRSFAYQRSEEEAPYVFRHQRNGEEDGPVRCMLCRNSPDAGQEHFQASQGEHMDRLFFWTKLREAFEPLREAVLKEHEAMGNAGPTAVAPGSLAAAWKEELLKCLKETSVPDDVLGLLWQTVVLREWDSVVRLDGSADELASVAQALESMMEVAVRPEPRFTQAAPKPGVDFVVYPPPGATASLSDDTLEEEAERFTPQDLLGEGIETRRDGKSYWCGYCEEEIAGDGLAKHILPFFQTGKRHRKCMEVSQQAFELLEVDGWRLGSERITIYRKEFSCTACSKKGPWYEVWQHMENKGHRKAVGSVPTRTAAQEQEESAEWRNSLNDVLGRHTEGLREAASAAAAALAAARAAPAPAADAASAGTARRAAAARGRQEPPPAEQASSSSSQAPPARRPAEPEELPPLPDPEKDFDWRPRSCNGLEERGGKWYCLFCNSIEVKDKETHLAKKDHLARTAQFFEGLKQLRENGWRLRREGITLAKKQFYCRFCEREAYWWDLFNVPPHYKTNGHMKRRRGQADDHVPDEAPDDDPEKVAWEEMFAKLEAGEAAGQASSEVQAEPPQDKSGKAGKRPKMDALEQFQLEEALRSSAVETEAQERRQRQRTAGPSEQSSGPPPAAVSTSGQASQSSRGSSAPPPAKRSRVDEPQQEGQASSSPGSAPAGSGSASAGSGSGGAPARPPESAKYFRDPPDEGSIAAANKRASSVWCPALPHPALTWGYFRKPALWMWCKACREWVAVVDYNYNTQMATSEDGECPHYDRAAARRFNDAMQQVLAGKW